MSYEKIVEWCVVKIDRLLYSRSIADRLWYFAEARVQHFRTLNVSTRVVSVNAPLDAAPPG
jgi:hypothetical protein